MAKMTMLEMVQDILGDMESDEVGSISDTVEAEGVARIIRSTYFELVENKRIPEHNSLFQLDSLADVTRPNYLKFPTNLLVGEIFKYDTRKPAETRKLYRDVKYRNPPEFLDLLDARDNSDTNVITVVDFSGVELFIRKDVAPTYWTTFDDEYLVCDSYDAVIDTTLQASKTKMWGKLEPTFDAMDNTFIPDIDSNYFPLLLSHAKMKCFDLMKQNIPPTVSNTARKQAISVQANKNRFDLIDDVPDYGRK